MPGAGPVTSCLSPSSPWISLCVSFFDGELNSASRAAWNQIPTSAHRPCPGDRTPRPPRERLMVEAWQGGKLYAQGGAPTLLIPKWGGELQCGGDAPHGQQRAPLTVKCHVLGRPVALGFTSARQQTTLWPGWPLTPPPLAPPAGPPPPVLLARQPTPSVIFRSPGPPQPCPCPTPTRVPGAPGLPQTHQPGSCGFSGRHPKPIVGRSDQTHLVGGTMPRP